MRGPAVTLAGVTVTDTVPAAIAAIARGGMAVVVDDADREDEGDLIMAAGCVTAADVAFIVRHGSGVVCVALSESRADELALPLMVPAGRDPMGTAFTVTVDAVGTGTGISAPDRAVTIRALADPSSLAGGFRRPGHVFPLRSRPHGVLQRRGHTEASVDLARLAGHEPAGVLCEIVAPDGSMARGAELARFASEHELPLVSIADLARYRLRHERTVERFATTAIATRYGVFAAHAYRSVVDGDDHVAYVLGDVTAGDDRLDDDPVLVRVHFECLTGDLLGSPRGDCGSQLEQALERIGTVGRGVLVSLRGHEGRGTGLGPKLHANAAQDHGLDTVDANLSLGFPVDARSYGRAAGILADLGVRTVRLITNNPAKVAGLEEHGIRVVERLAIETTPNPPTSSRCGPSGTASGPCSTSMTAAATGEHGRADVREWAGHLDGRGLRIAIVASRFNDIVTRRLVEGARDALARTGVAPHDVDLAWVPGAFEIPLVARRLAESRRFDAIVCLGAVIRGDTPHFDHVAGPSANGIAAIAADTGVPTMFGVLTTDTTEQAVARAGGKAGNTGADAAMAAVELATLLRVLDTEIPGTRQSAEPNPA